MTRRLLIQFGVAAFSLAVTSGIASADSQSGAAVTTANLVQQDTSSATSNVTSNYALSTSVGPGSGNSNQSGGGTGSGGPTGGSSSVGGSGGSATTMLQPPDSTTLGAQTPGTPDGSATPPSTTSGSDPSAPAAITTGTPPSTPPSGTDSDGGPNAIYANQPVNIAQLVDQATVAAAASANPPQLVADSNSSAPPTSNSGLPRNAAGFLAEFPLLMAQVMIPVLHTLPLATLVVTLAATLILLATAGLNRLVTALSRNTHTARLRRSGFLGAARSDVGAATLLFATPPEMSSMLVYAT